MPERLHRRSVGVGPVTALPDNGDVALHQALEAAGKQLMRQVVERARHVYFLEVTDSRLEELPRCLQLVEQAQKAHRIVVRCHRLTFLSFIRSRLAEF